MSLNFFEKKIKLTGFLTLVILLMFMTKIYGQDAVKPDVIEGSDKITSFKCKDNSCTYEYQNYIVTTTIKGPGEGTDIVVTDKKSIMGKHKKSLSIKAERDNDKSYYLYQGFDGIYGDSVIIESRTSPYGAYFIYDIKKEKIVNSFGNMGKMKIANGNLSFMDRMSVERQKKLKLKDKTTNDPSKISEGHGYWDECNYNFKTNKIVTEKYQWLD